MHILWLKTELLHPVDKGGKIRTYQTLKHLKAQHRVTYLCLDDGTAAPDAEARSEEYCHDLIRIPFTAPSKGSGAFFADLARNVFSTLPYAVARYRSAAMREAIRRAVRERAIDLVICDFLTPSLNVPNDLGVPTLLFQHNVEAAIWERHTAVAVHPVKKAYMREQWRRMRAFERHECHRFDHVIAVSDADRDAFREQYGVTSVSSVPTGVDTDFFQPSGAVVRLPHNIAFTGSMDWMPNEDGVAWFVRDVLPLVRQQVGDATLSIVGRNPSPGVKALASAAPAIEVTGTVPDIRPFLERAAVIVVPLRVGGGTRLKIFEAMGMERPIVSTTIGAEGLPVVDGRDIRIADDAASFATAVIQLLQDPGEGDRLGKAAARQVREEFGWQRVTAQFADACRATVEQVQQRRPAGQSAGRAA
ncbi:MAG: glycosyltransferase [Gemmatimonadaceae bacterium]|nr:glycosyltransferase [Gemmatimonadaceae bacterium]